METHIDYQVIEQNGKPAFAVLPYDDFIKLIHPEPTIPHEVVEMLIKKNMNLPRAWREHLGLTQEDVAKKMGITQAALSQMEKTDAKLRHSTLQRLADSLSLSVEQLTD
jgi:DNA-binding XRE family transcriptional regulator